MDPTSEQLQAFAAETRRRRDDAGLTTKEVAERMTKILGRTVSRQSVTQWENAQNGPRDTPTARALDEVLSANGELAAMLASDTDAIFDRLDALEAQNAQMGAELKAQQSTLKSILRRLDRGGRG